jgi:hypothetical protein
MRSEKFGAKDVCAKCTGTNIRTKFCTGICYDYARPLQMKCWQPPNGDHLHRICASCGYNWLEETADLQHHSKTISDSILSGLA